MNIPKQNCFHFGKVLTNWTQYNVKIFKSVKQRNLKVVEQALKDNPFLIDCTDCVGNTLLHWSAKYNAAHICSLLITYHVNVDQINVNGQTALHLACSHKSFETMVCLIRAGCSKEEVDGDGLCALHHAAKSGDLAISTFAIFLRINLRTIDYRGCLPLHYAAYSGNANLCSLFLRFDPLAISYVDLRQNTALHLASTTGNFAAASVLIKTDPRLLPTFMFTENALILNLPNEKNSSNEFFYVVNRDGNRAEDAARQAGYYELSEMIKYEKHCRTKTFNSAGKRDAKLPIDVRFRNVMLGPPGRRRALLFYMFLISFGWMYPYLWFRIRNSCMKLSTIQEFLFACANLIMWICFFKELATDPGFLPQNTIEYELAMHRIFEDCCRLAKPSRVSTYCLASEIWPAQLNTLTSGLADLRMRLQSLCHTCGCVKPLRAKHCGQCNRCVHMMDHHCPVTDNCVGMRNRVWFLLTGLFVGVVSTAIGYLAFMVWYLSEMTSRLELLTWLLLFSGWTSALSAFTGTLSRAAANVTTNELVNWRRYAHFNGPNNSFHNPFNRGIWRNFIEFFKPVKRCDAYRTDLKHSSNRQTLDPLIV